MTTASGMPAFLCHYSWPAAPQGICSAHRQLEPWQLAHRTAALQRHPCVMTGRQQSQRDSVTKMAVRVLALQHQGMSHISKNNCNEYIVTLQSGPSHAPAAKLQAFNLHPANLYIPCQQQPYAHITLTHPGTPHPNPSAHLNAACCVESFPSTRPASKPSLSGVLNSPTPQPGWPPVGRSAQAVAVSASRTGSTPAGHTTDLLVFHLRFLVVW
jgi:hypothetical protein